MISVRTRVLVEEDSDIHLNLLIGFAEFFV
jgi:hypothetical protein